MTEPARDLGRHQRWAIGAVGVLAGAAILLLGGRLVHIQAALSPRLTVMMDRQQAGVSLIPARRGNIFDARGRVLAGSRRAPAVFADPGTVKDLEQAAAHAAAILGLDAGEIEDRIRNSGTPRFCWIKRRISPQEAAAIRQAELPGFGVTDEAMRHYPLGPSLGQVLGFVGREGQGLEGLELGCDRWLRGTDGSVRTVRDARRRAIRERTGQQTAQAGRVEPVDGGHVVLTLDAVIQGFVEEFLPRQVHQFEAESGVAVVMDPRTADVLAMACYPTFDPNDRGAVVSSIWRNRVVTDMVEPGSTFKPFVASGALVAGVVSPGERIFCHDGLYVSGRRLLHDSSPHGVMTFEEIISRSSNIGMAIIGERLGNPAMHDIVRRYGFGTPTGIDMPGEAAGGVLPLSRWNTYSTTSVPMGHEIAVTPLQLITAFCAIANDGILLRPRAVRAYLRPDGTVDREFTGPEPVRRVLPEATARYLVNDVLVKVVEDGGGHRAALPGYRVFGKTGTAQVPYEDRRGYEPGAYLGSFVGAAPLEDPQVVALVMIRKPNPRLGYYGGQISAPAVRDILDRTLAYLQVPPRPQNDAAAR
ncbi:MAG: penicillin-binding protein 2 [bacterium]|nr:penicillin-binding protein 2 [bacterium]